MSSDPWCLALTRHIELIDENEQEHQDLNAGRIEREVRVLLNNASVGGAKEMVTKRGPSHFSEEKFRVSEPLKGQAVPL